MTVNASGLGVVVTGAGHGIGRAIARRLAEEGARVVVNDLDPQAAAAVAHEVGGLAMPEDCATAEGVSRLVQEARRHLGRIDCFFANAGVDVGGGLDTSADTWSRAMDVNVMAHVRAAEALVPAWLDDGQGGRFVITASAASLLTMLGNAPYSVSKHAALAFAEWLSATYRDLGITVQAICPQGVHTQMLDNLGSLSALLGGSDALTADEVAAEVWRAMQDDRFLVLPHPEVQGYYQRRAADTDRWLRSMNRLQQRLDVPRLTGHSTTTFDARTS